MLDLDRRFPVDRYGPLDAPDPDSKESHPKCVEAVYDFMWPLLGNYKVTPQR